jgi:hypothetical protein
MQVRGITDLIVQPLYDTVAIPMAGSTLLTFFQVPIGQGTTVFGAGAKHLGDTNMNLAGQLPAGFAFQINGFRMMFSWNVVFADIQVVVNAAVFRFSVGQKDFLQVPARTLPSGNGPFYSGNITAGAAVALVTSGWPHMGNNFGIKGKPLILNSTENFAAILQWQGGVQALSAITPVTIVLDGYLGRPVQ